MHWIGPLLAMIILLVPSFKSPTSESRSVWVRVTSHTVIRSLELMAQLLTALEKVVRC